MKTKIINKGDISNLKYSKINDEIWHSTYWNTNATFFFSFHPTAYFMFVTINPVQLDFPLLIPELVLRNADIYI